MQETYTLERTGLTADVNETDLNGTYAVRIAFSKDFDGPLYPGVAGQETLDMANELWGEEEDHFEALYVSDGEAALIFPDGDREKAEQVVEQVVESVDRYYDELGDAPLEEYLAELSADAH